MNVTNHIGKDLINVPQFAKEKNVSPTAVWDAIKAERISVTLVGKAKKVYIKWGSYKDLVFDENKKNR